MTPAHQRGLEVVCEMLAHKNQERMSVERENDALEVLRALKWNISRGHLVPDEMIVEAKDALAELEKECPPPL